MEVEKADALDTAGAEGSDEGPDTKEEPDVEAVGMAVVAVGELDKTGRHAEESRTDDAANVLEALSLEGPMPKSITAAGEMFCLLLAGAARCLPLLLVRSCFLSVF